MVTTDILAIYKYCSFSLSIEYQGHMLMYKASSRDSAILRAGSIVSDFWRGSLSWTGMQYNQISQMVVMKAHMPQYA